MKKGKNLYANNYFKRSDFLSDRIRELIKDKKFFEIVLWFSNIFEGELTIILSLYEKIIKHTDEIHHKFLLAYNPREPEDIRNESRTLGFLKNELSRYLRDKEIESLLKNFIETRNKIFHKFFETSEDPKITEKEIESRIDTWWRLAYQLNREMGKCFNNYNELLEIETKKKGE